MKYTEIANNEILEKVVESLAQRNIEAIVVNTKEEAREKVLSMIPKGSEVMSMSSMTLIETGINDALETGGYELVKDKLKSMNRETQNREMQQIGAAPQYSLGSVHAITHDGVVVIASNTGSQLPGYSYGSEHVIWVVGAQKIVANLDEAMKRIYEYIVPLESVRLGKAYGNQELKTNVSKILIVNKEVNPERIKMVIVKEKLGF